MPTEYFILARLKASIPKGEPVPVTDHPCAKCGRMCGISPSSVKAIAKHGWPVHCTECAKLEECSIFATLPEAIEERRLNSMAREAKERRK